MLIPPTVDCGSTGKVVHMQLSMLAGMFSEEPAGLENLLSLFEDNATGGRKN